MTFDITQHLKATDIERHMHNHAEGIDLSAISHADQMTAYGNIASIVNGTLDPQHNKGASR